MAVSAIRGRILHGGKWTYGRVKTFNAARGRSAANSSQYTTAIERRNLHSRDLMFLFSSIYGWCHPHELSKVKIEAFLTCLAIEPQRSCRTGLIKKDSCIRIDPEMRQVFSPKQTICQEALIVSSGSEAAISTISEKRSFSIYEPRELVLESYQIKAPKKPVWLLIRDWVRRCHHYHLLTHPVIHRVAL